MKSLQFMKRGMPMSDTLSKLTKILGKSSKEDMKDVHGGTTLDQLGLDSLDFINVMFELEDAFGITLPFNANDAEELALTANMTLQELAERVDDRRAAANAATQ